MKYAFSIFFMVVTVALWPGCRKSDKEHKPIISGGDKPAPVTNMQVKNFEGGAYITYSLPKGPDVLYAKAVYRINKDQTREEKVSVHSDTIKVEGFQYSQDYDVQITTVSRSEVESDPVTVKVHPDTPTYQRVRGTLSMLSDFGGVNISFSNPNEGNMALVLITRDKNNDLMIADTRYTKQKGGSYTVRGYEPVKRTFGLYVRDRWGNLSDTLWADITPLEEQELDKNKFREKILPTDAPSDFGWVLSNLWDGKVTEPGFHTNINPMPLHFTFDLGVKAKLSRMKGWQRQGILYGNGNPKRFEVWGSNDPAPDGSFTGWEKLGTFTSVKPSGLPYGQYNNEDREHAINGEEFVFPASAPASRYIRIVLLENWAGNGYIHWMEVSFWGKVL